MAEHVYDQYEQYFAEKLWESIPGIYRHEDGLGENPGVLRALVEVMAAQAALLRRSNDRLWEDQFIELCANWVTPYLGDLVATLTVRPDLCTTGAILHGGAVMAFADTLGAVGTFLNLPQGARTTTVDSSTKFIGAAPAGSIVTGTCTAFHRGRTTMVWQTEVRSDAGKLCAVVTQTQLVIPA